LPSKHSHERGRKKIVARTFNLDTKLRPSSLLARAKRAAYDNGATLLGDERSGASPTTWPRASTAWRGEPSSSP
jgi:hypothetical protein